MIRYDCEDIRFSLTGKRLVTRWLNRVAGNASKKIGELNYIFCSDPYLLTINKQYLGHDYCTDIITFDFSDDYAIEGKGDRISGDIYISIDTVRYNAEAYGEGFDRELHRVIVHGLLHLIGFDDVTPELQNEMTFQENKALDILFQMRNEG
ncbi:MAG: rRNA maturation RNase YbeY [Bacteroidales bacterium]|nr:rRNA maturation RNase YbeY [Bacteroidales bacterium]